MKPRLLDLFCGAGGCSFGYHRAGFEVVGVDINPQPRYPFEFHQADAMTFPMDGFDVVHASPPCQRWSAAGNDRDRSKEPDFLNPIKEKFYGLKIPWVIENVMPAPIKGVVLCGSMFGLRTHRHRRFETSFLILQPQIHSGPTPKTSTHKRKKCLTEGKFISVTGYVGSFVGPPCMGIDWMTGKELSQAIPPAYTEFIGKQLMNYLTK